MTWYYPHGKPVEFSYTNDFVTKETFHGEDAKKNILRQKNIAGGVISDKGRSGAAIAELDRMISMARTSEQNFLTSHGFKNPGNNWNKLITDINKILSTENAFKRNVQLLKQFNEGDKRTKSYQDVTTFFKGYLQTAIIDNLKVDVNATAYEILEKATKDAIDSMSKMTDFKTKEGKIRTTKSKKDKDNVSILNAFSELFSVIEVMKDSEFLLKINELFQLEDYIEEVRQQLLNGKEENFSKLKYKGSNTGKGTLAEILYSAVSNGLNGSNESITWQTIEHTGTANYKPDRVLATMVVSYNQAVDTIKNNDINYGKSTRARGVATMEQLFIDLKDAKGDLVLISDKNYIINKGFRERGGFKAQDETSLNALEGLFSSLHINVFNIDALINYLANIGSNLIETEVDNKILRAISTQVGNFLFDDLSFDESAIPGGINVIHIFQLSGIYVPLSIILEGVRRGVSNLQNTELSAYVEVDFKASNDVPEKWGKDSGEDVFTSFRNTKMQNNSITVHFLKDFASVIAENVKI